MPRYIERGKIIDGINRLWDANPTEDEYSPFGQALDSVTAIVEDAPTADVAPVVRCKDCKFRTECGNCGHPRHEVLPSAYPNDFCSYGARMEGGGQA